MSYENNSNHKQMNMRHINEKQEKIMYRANFVRLNKINKAKKKLRDIKSPDRNFYARQLRNIDTRDRLQQKWFEKYKHIPGENVYEAGFYNQLGQMEQMNQFQTYKDSRHVSISLNKYIHEFIYSYSAKKYFCLSNSL
jgi:hypothetical protein